MVFLRDRLGRLFARRTRFGIIRSMAGAVQAVYAQLLRDLVAPALRAEGMQGSGNRYLLCDDEWWAQVGFQKSRYSRSDAIKVTVNLSLIRKSDWTENRREHSYLKDTPPAGELQADWDVKRLEESFYPVKPSPNEFPFKRIGHLIPHIGSDHWWLLTSEDGLQVMTEIVEAVRIYGLPALRKGIQTGALL